MPNEPALWRARTYPYRLDSGSRGLWPAPHGRTVTADAMHTQREASALIVEKGGDYILSSTSCSA